MAGEGLGEELVAERLVQGVVSALALDGEGRVARIVEEGSRYRLVIIEIDCGILQSRIPMMLLTDLLVAVHRLLPVALIQMLPFPERGEVGEVQSEGGTSLLLGALLVREEGGGVHVSAPSIWDNYG